MSLKTLRKTSSLKEFATLLGLQPKGLSYILYVIEEESKYTEFEIPKRSGGIRKINAPIPQLKEVQSRLAKLLLECSIEIDKTQKHKYKLSHGFTKDCSILTNAYVHRHRRYVFNVDILNFFPSFNFGRVRGFFIKNNHFKLDPKIATIISQIACHKNELPQGSPCSPIISNLIGHLIDIRIVNLAKITKCTYTRYADDITFSTNKKEFPESIGILKEGTDNEWLPGKVLQDEITNIGFELNLSKTSLQSKTNRQSVTGLIVNNGISVKREYYKILRAMCNSLFTNNSFYIPSRIPKLPDSTSNSNEDTESLPGTLNQLEGILSFIYSAKTFEDKFKTYNEKKKKKNSNFFNPPNFIKLYREFLYYKHFFINNKPSILCEGKTDPVYLKYALKKVGNKFNELITNNEDGINFNFTFTKYSQNFKQIVSRSGGTAGIINILKDYKTQMGKFKSEGKKNPVIVLLDNDTGAREIIKKHNIVKKNKPFYNLFQNLYIVFIPTIPNKKDNEIEDLFDEKTLKTKIDGKTFNRNLKINNKKEYSKSDFAEKVIKAKWKSINFDNFKPIFKCFEAVINFHKNKVK